MTTQRLAYAGAALAALWLAGRAGVPGRALRHAAVWGAVALGLYVALAVIGAPAAWRVPVSPYTVGAGALLGAPGIGLAMLAHALFR